MRPMRALLLSSCLFSALLAAPVTAQEGTPAPVPSGDVASCDVCMPSAVPRGPIQVLFQPGWQAGLDHQYTPFKDLRFDGEGVANPAGEKILSNTTQFHLTYNVSPKAGFLISIPYHNKSYRRLGSNGVESGTVSGIGDMVVRARFTPVANFDEHHTLVWTVEAGIKLPTGDSSMLREQDHVHGSSTTTETPHHHEDEDSEHDEDEDHEHHDRAYLAHEGHEHEEEEEAGPVVAEQAMAGLDEHTHNTAVEGHDLALGSGSVDGVLGTGVIYRTGDFYATGGLQYLLRSTGTAGYRYGDLTTWRVAPGYLFINKENRVVGLQVNISGEHHDPNTVFGEKDHGYTDIVYAGPEVLVQGENLSLNLGLDLPVKYHAEGLTLAPDYRARMHFNWRF